MSNVTQLRPARPMSEGERQIWVSSFTNALARGRGPWTAARLAHEAVEHARTLLASNVLPLAPEARRKLSEMLS